MHEVIQNAQATEAQSTSIQLQIHHHHIWKTDSLLKKRRYFDRIIDYYNEIIDSKCYDKLMHFARCTQAALGGGHALGG